MTLPVVYRRRVGRDLAGAYGWYEEQHAGLGEEFLVSVGASVGAIEQFPDMFARVHGEVRRAFVARFPYAVCYRVEPNRIVVLTVLHTARDPKLWPQPPANAR
jgi:plasmid stabilization system protein ParE